jgi:ribosome-associated translation inhibitor RaiA
MFEKFKFKKFNPESEIVNYANTSLSQVIDLAPDNSHCYASLTKLGDTFTGWIEITSQEGHFSAESRSDDPRAAVDILEERIIQKIKKWKNERRFTERVEQRLWSHGTPSVA